MLVILYLCHVLFITFMDKMSKTSFVGKNIMGYVYFCMRETDNHKKT